MPARRSGILQIGTGLLKLNWIVVADRAADRSSVGMESHERMIDGFDTGLDTQATRPKSLLNPRLFACSFFHFTNPG